MTEKYVPTANEFVAVPTLRESDGAIESINFLHMGLKGLIEICGDSTAAMPFLKPVLRISGQEVAITPDQWERINYWIPRWHATCQDLSVSGTLLLPVGERGFAYHLSIRNQSNRTIAFEAGSRGCWARTLQTINESKPIQGHATTLASNWNDSYVFEMSGTGALFAFAPIFEKPQSVSEARSGDNGIEFCFLQTCELEPGAETEVVQFWGLGYEEVAATTAAKEMLRQTYDRLYQRTVQWLAGRTLHSKQPQLNEMLNTNSFFNLFFASGLTLDTEERVLVTSRSPRYYVSAAFWDRDSMLWSFPALLLADSDLAREALDYVFTRQIRNIGVHSRFIDGTVLEPGFELDELCAPILAIDRYIRKTGDVQILRQPSIDNGIRRILQILKTCRHPELNLYETFLQPTDDVIVHPYLTYDNVLVWKALTILDSYKSELQPSLVTEPDWYQAEAARVREAIQRHCIRDYKGKAIYAWSVDPSGHWNVYDEPPGSLLILPYLGFCDINDPVFANTSAVIRDPEYPYSFHGCRIAEIGCAHAPHPWILSLANSLLCGRTGEFLAQFPYLKMDNGIACESVDEETGECTTGEAFATCAGFLVFAMAEAFGLEE